MYFRGLWSAYCNSKTTIRIWSHCGSVGLNLQLLCVISPPWSACFCYLKSYCEIARSTLNKMSMTHIDSWKRFQDQFRMRFNGKGPERFNYLEITTAPSVFNSWCSLSGVCCAVININDTPQSLWVVVYTSMRHLFVVVPSVASWLVVVVVMVVKMLTRTRRRLSFKKNNVIW